MAITPLEAGLDIIAALPDEPNDVGGLSSSELKAKFDEAGNTIKTYVNDSLIPRLDGENLPLAYGAEGGQTIRQAIEEATVGTLPDGSITTEKLAPGVGEALTADLSTQVEELASTALTPADKATESEAITGELDTKWMTPVTTKASIDSNVIATFDASTLRYVNKTEILMYYGSFPPISYDSYQGINMLQITPDKTRAYIISSSSLVVRDLATWALIANYTLTYAGGVILSYDNDTVAIGYSGYNVIEIYRVYSDHVEAGPTTTFPTTFIIQQYVKAVYTPFHSSTALYFAVMNAAGDCRGYKFLKSTSVLSLIATSGYPTSSYSNTAASNPVGFNVLNGVVVTFVSGSGTSGTATITYVYFLSVTGTVTQLWQSTNSISGTDLYFSIAPTEDGFFVFYPSGNSLKKYITTSMSAVLDYTVALTGSSSYSAGAGSYYLINVEDKLLVTDSSVMDIVTNEITALANHAALFTPEISYNASLSRMYLCSSYNSNITAYSLDLLGLDKMAGSSFSSRPACFLYGPTYSAILLKEGV